jgi:hypothetical protein
MVYEAVTREILDVSERGPWKILTSFHFLDELTMFYNPLAHTSGVLAPRYFAPIGKIDFPNWRFFAVHLRYKLIGGVWIWSLVNA